MPVAPGQPHSEIESKSLPTHVALCSERYLGIHKRLGRIERRLDWGGATLVLTIIAIAIRLWMG